MRALVVYSFEGGPFFGDRRLCVSALCVGVRALEQRWLHGVCIDSLDHPPIPSPSPRFPLKYSTEAQGGGEIHKLRIGDLGSPRSPCLVLGFRVLCQGFAVPLK